MNRRILSPAVLGLSMAVAVASPRPAAALECSDYQALMVNDVPKTVIQHIVFEAPPLDGWACLKAAELSLASLDMAIAFARLDTQENLRWTVRFRKCEASTELRKGTKRLLKKLESGDEAQPPALDDGAEVGPGSVDCREAVALQEAIRAR